MSLNPACNPYEDPNIEKNHNDIIPDFQLTYCVTIEPSLNEHEIFDRVCLTPATSYYRYHSYDLEKVLSNKIEVKDNKIFKYLIINPNIKKYLERISPQVLCFLRNAYFNLDTDFIPYHRNRGNDYFEEKSYETFWFGKFLKTFSEEKITNSVTMLSLSNYICFNIDENKIILFINNTDDFGFSDTSTNSNYIEIDKNQVNFSTYKSFIKSLNFLCKKIRISMIEPEHFDLPNRGLSKSISFNKSVRSIMNILHSECFYDIEHVYDEIMKRGLNQ